MTAITTRAGKGAALTWNEADTNFTNLQATADAAMAAALAAVDSPGGADTQIQYNNATAFGGSASLTWTESTKRLRVNGASGTCASPGTMQIYGADATGNTGFDIGGRIEILAGDGSATGGAGGRLQLYSGDATSTGLGDQGGHIWMLSGDGDLGGEIQLECGESADGAGSDFKIRSGNTIKGGANGGNVLIQYGSGGVGGTGGTTYITDQGNTAPIASFWATGNTRFGYTKTDPGYKVQIDGQAANVALYILQGATAGTALSMYDSTSSYYLNFQPGASSYLTYNSPLKFYSGGADQLTLSTAGVLNATGDVQVAGLSVRAIPQNIKDQAYTTVLSDAGKHLLHSGGDASARTWTIDSNANVAYPVGTAITFVNQNGAGVITIAITSDTMRLAGAGTTGSRTLAANGIATALKIATTEWIISGTGLT